MSRGQCKFCGCNERRSCAIAAVKFPFAPDEPALARDYYILAPGVAVVPPDAETFMVPCSWLLDDVCLNPACVEKAYAEARDRWTARFLEEAA